MKQHRGYDEWPFLQWLQPLVRYLRSSMDEFPAGAFAIFCAFIGVAGGVIIGNGAMKLFGFHWEVLPFCAGFFGGVGGVVFALQLICWLADE